MPELRFNSAKGLSKTEDDGFKTETSRQQAKVEESVEKCWLNVIEQSNQGNESPLLFRQLHLAYLQGSLFTLPRSYESLDCSRPWLAYWIVHSLALLEDQQTLLSAEKRACHFLNSCVNSDTGGFGGGPGQLAHLATTYAAINAFVSLNSTSALQQMDRENVYRFLKKMKQPDGSFTMHVDGEIDVRGVYCAASVAHICNIQDEKLFENTVEWVLKCQTYEGGFGPCPDNEAHGGYTFCAIASLILLNKFDDIDLPRLLNWLANRQMQYDGGFSGRTNKLVDGCYSFWQGASFPLVHLILSKKCPDQTPCDRWLFDQKALQEYVLCCCQTDRGGLLDKPGRTRDFYHTCYNLSGLSLAQHSLMSDLVIGSSKNALQPIHPVYNLTVDAVELAKSTFIIPI